MKKCNFIIVVILLLVNVCIHSDENVKNTLNLKGIKASQIKVVKTTMLTDDGQYTNPQWSPNGKHIAFTKLPGKGLYVMNVNDKEKMQILDDESEAVDFAWSPDGNKIAYKAKRKMGKEQYKKNVIAVVEIAEELSAGKRRLKKTSEAIIEELTGDLYAPVWSISGEELLYKKGRHQEISERIKLSELVRAKTSKTFLLKKGVKLIEENKKVFILNNTGKKVKIADYGYNPELLEDGRVRYQIEDNLYVVYDGEWRKIYFGWLTGHAYWDNGKPIRKVELSFVEDSSYSISPDGNYIIFADEKDDGHKLLASDLKVKKTGDNEICSLTDTPDIIETQPDWSPDGRNLVFVDQNKFVNNIYLLEIDVVK